LPEWVIEEGIGETRAALVEDGEIVAARVRREGVTAAGTALEARLAAVAPRVTVEADGEQFLLPLGVSGVSEGRRLLVEVTREPMGGREAWKRGLARLTDTPPRAAPPLAEGRPGRIEGWEELVAEARTGTVGFDGGELRIEPTAAMTVIDVDGWLVPDKLAQVAAWAAARAIGRLDLGGSIVIDFPTLKGKADRARVDSILDDYLPRPFERTAMNGFGLVQIVRPRARASLVDLASDRAAFEARALLRRAGAEIGAIRLVASPAVASFLEQRPDWIERLARQIGGAVSLRAEPTLAMAAAYAERT
jgi:ribonuclease G